MYQANKISPKNTMLSKKKEFYFVIGKKKNWPYLDLTI